jgi:uncharacterized membrane protein YgcG
MADALRNSEVTRALSDLLADLSDLVQKEIRLAKAEIGEKITSRLQASVWMAAAGFIGVVAMLLVVEAAVFALVVYGLQPYWACLLMAVVLAAGAAAAFFHGRSMANEELTPTRTVKQVSEDIRIAKEQLT